MIRRRRRLNEATEMQGTWSLDGELQSDVTYRDWVVRRTINRNMDEYMVDFQMLREKDFSGGWLKNPRWEHLLDSPRKFRRLNDAIEFAETEYKTLVSNYIGGYME